jgi:hypothetical protein
VKSLGRNDPCHCGSGRKYKHCCLEKDEAQEREARAKAAAEAKAAPEEATAGEAANEPAQPQAKHKRPTEQPWKRGPANTRGVPRFAAPRKVGGA